MDKQELIEKFAAYKEEAVKVATELEKEASELREKIAIYEDELDRYNSGIHKVAELLESNNLLGNYNNKEDFIKNAENTPSVLAHIFEQTQNKTKVATIGSSSNVSFTSYEHTDPITFMALGKKFNPQS